MRRIALLVVLIAGLAGTAVAKTNPAVACAAFKLKSAGALASALLACHAKAAQGGEDIDPKCLEVPRAKLAAGFAKAESVARKAGSPCPVENDAADTQSEIDTRVAGIVAALRPAPGFSKCAAKKLGAVGKHVFQVLGARAKNLIKPDTEKLASAVGKSGAALTSTFAKADDKGKDCQTSGDTAPLAAAVAALVGVEVCDDQNRCTVDTIAGLQTCVRTALTCGAYEACDFRTGGCEPTNCCLMSLGSTSCVVPIPNEQIPVSQAFCSSLDAADDAVTLISFGSSCIGWRAAGANDCE